MYLKFKAYNYIRRLEEVELTIFSLVHSHASLEGLIVTPSVHLQ